MADWEANTGHKTQYKRTRHYNETRELLQYWETTWVHSRQKTITKNPRNSRNVGIEKTGTINTHQGWQHISYRWKQSDNYRAG